MLTWARAPLLPQQNTPPPCPPGPWTGHQGTSREQVYPSLHKPVQPGPGARSVSQNEIQYCFLQEAFQADPQRVGSAHTHPALTLNDALPSPASPLAHHIGLAWVSTLLAVGLPYTLTQEPLREGPCGHRGYCAQLSASHGRLGSEQFFEGAQNSVQVTEPGQEQPWEVTSNVI